ncbi:TPA: hypothetical protein DCL30_02540 [Candidatus Peribacteria bacterium]|nr:hypothetical protein [Candidatus Peribacteria bacterium]HAS33821.1 hypothetical protein [Candidatus Peribacteria bacterium]
MAHEVGYPRCLFDECPFLAQDVEVEHEISSQTVERHREEGVAILFAHLLATLFTMRDAFQTAVTDLCPQGVRFFFGHSCLLDESFDTCGALQSRVTQSAALGKKRTGF